MSRTASEVIAAAHRYHGMNAPLPLVVDLARVVEAQEARIATLEAGAPKPKPVLDADWIARAREAIQQLGEDVQRGRAGMSASYAIGVLESAIDAVTASDAPTRAGSTGE